MAFRLPAFTRANVGRFLGSAVSGAAGFAFGAATAPVLSPAVETLRQAAWSQYKSRALGWGDIAGIVAEDVQKQSWGETEAGLTGLDQARFDALLGEALNAPGINQLFELWRRGQISDADFAHGLRKGKLETRWDGPLEALKDVLLSPETLANARQQGFVDVARQHSESALQGVTQDRADIMFELSGNPPGPETMMRAVNRGLTDQATFTQAIREGRTKTKYTDLLWQLRANVLSASTYVTAFLKGHITQAEMHAGGAKWGYSSSDMDIWYETSGNPATPHQIHIGYARGATLPGAANEEAAIRASVKQGRTRPEYFDLLYAGRYTLPPFFAFRALLTDGVITTAEARNYFIQMGWPPDLATTVAAHYGGLTTAAKPDTHLSKAQVQLWSTTHKSYLAGEITRTAARNALGQAGVAGTSITPVLGTWDAEKALIRAQLTAANIKKAFNKGGRNNATGKAWTRDEALAALIDLGWAALAANDYLDIP